MEKIKAILVAAGVLFFMAKTQVHVAVGSTQMYFPVLTVIAALLAMVTFLVLTLAVRSLFRNWIISRPSPYTARHAR